MSWSDFALNPQDRQFLESRLRHGTLPQTLLLEGGREEERRALAKEIAAAIVCQGDGARPCGVCRACVKSRADSHPDIKFYAPEKKNSIFKVETCREIRQDAFILPNDGDCKVYILEDSQNMNDSSENALLKILEEPPAGVYFVLTCDSRFSMLPTVLSRAVVLSLTGEVCPFSDETLETAFGLAEAVVSQSELALLRATAGLEKDRDAVKTTLMCLSEIFENALKQKNGGTPAAQYAEPAALLCEKLTNHKLYALWNTAGELKADADRNANTNLLVTGLCYRLRRAAENKTEF